MRDQTIVKTSGISMYYGKTMALSNVGIEVQKGDIYGLIGDNGAGKTTLLKVLTGQIFPTVGEVSMFGEHQQRELLKVRKRTGAIIESPGFYPKLSAECNLEYYRIQRGVPGKEKVGEVLRKVGLYEVRKKKFETFSLGMKQRLGLALSLLGNPELLILDEPINGLDPSGIIEIRNFLLKLNQERKITIIISSHILTELEQIATVYGFLSKGKLLEQITVEQLKEQCSEVVEIEVNRPEMYTALLEKELNCNNYKVMPDKTISIRTSDEEMACYSRLAAKHGIEVLRLNRRKVPLEDYYVNLKALKGAKTVC